MSAIPARVLSLFDVLLACEDERERDTIARRVHEGIHAIPRWQERAECWYLLGYAGYLAHREAAEVEQQLEAAVERDPKHGRAWLYLGHVAYDRGAYERARAHFGQARQHLEPGYLHAKAHELLLCSDARRREALPRYADLRAYVEELERLDVTDIWPRELAQVWRRYRVAGTLDAELLALAVRIDAVGHFGRWFVEIVEDG